MYFFNGKMTWTCNLMVATISPISFPYLKVGNFILIFLLCFLISFLFTSLQVNDNLGIQNPIWSKLDLISWMQLGLRVDLHLQTPSKEKTQQNRKKEEHHPVLETCLGDELLSQYISCLICYPFDMKVIGLQSSTNFNHLFHYIIQRPGTLVLIPIK